MPRAPKNIGMSFVIMLSVTTMLVSECQLVRPASVRLAAHSTVAVVPSCAPQNDIAPPRLIESITMSCSDDAVTQSPVRMLAST